MVSTFDARGDRRAESPEMLGIPLAGNVGRSTTVQEKRLPLYSSPVSLLASRVFFVDALLIETLRCLREVLGRPMLTGS